MNPIFLALGLLAAAASPLAAHDFWIVPSSFHPRPGGPLALRLKVGEHLAGDAVPRDPQQIERFALVGPLAGAADTPGPEVPVAGPSGSEPAGYVEMGGPGLYWIVYDSARTRLDLPAAKFEEALQKEGLARISDLRRRRGESAAPSREVFSRCAKALVRAGAPGGPQPATGVERPLGLELELVPERDPMLLAAGEELPVRLLYQGKPLAGALVAALHPGPAGGAPSTVAARTGRDGRVRLALPAAGFWLVKAVHMVPAPAATGVDWESLWASLTFDVGSR